MYSDGSSKRLGHTCARPGDLACSRRKTTKDRRCASVATYQHITDKQTTEQSFGQPWKPYRVSGCQNWQSSPTHNTCSRERLARPNTGSQRDGQPFPHFLYCLRSTVPSHVALAPRMLPLSVHHCPWVPYPGTTRVPLCPPTLIPTLPSNLPWTLTQMMILVQHVVTTVGLNTCLPWPIHSPSHFPAR